MTASPDRLTRDALAVLQPAFEGADQAPSWLLRLLEQGMTGVGLFGRNIRSTSQVAALTGQLRQANPEVLVAIDEEGGDVTRLEEHHGSSFPGNHALGAADDPDLTRAVAAGMGRRLATAGVTTDWAPCADINSDPRNPVIGTRSFGDDPERVAQHTAAFVEGLQSTGVASCVKHFPGHGDTNVDSHLALPRIGVDLPTLHERELRPFRAAVAAGAKCVMTAHILVPALDPRLPGTLSPAVLRDLLRAPADQGGLGFDGLIFTDGMEMEAIAATWGRDRGSALAIAAGADAICVGGSPSDEADVLRLRDTVIEAVRAGDLSEERLHEAAERVRALGRWSAAARAADHAQATDTAVLAADAEAGLTAARRALRVTTRSGEPAPALAEAPYVVSLSAGTNIAVGDRTPWGIVTELRRFQPGTEEAAHTSADAEADGAEGLARRILAAAGDRPLVTVVRSLHRHPWMAATLDALLAARPESTVVEMGVPQSAPAGAVHLATHGSSRVCGRAAAEVLAGAQPS